MVADARQLRGGHPWHTVGDTGEPAFQNSWANRAGWETTQFTKDPLGFVHIKGVVDSGTTNTTIFTLPDGYRPSAKEQFTGSQITAAGVKRITITAAGLVGCVDANTGGVSLCGITFKAAT